MSGRLNQELTSDVQDNLEAIDVQKAREWGANIVDGVPQVQSLGLGVDYSERTVVRSEQDGLDAFKKYEAYFEHVLETFSADNDEAVILPCGAQKPIGTSAVHQKKLNALEQAGIRDDVDVQIMSEPCTIIPHSERLTMPAVNYDFPPKFTEEGEADRVFGMFVDNLAKWLDNCSYDRVYTYLVARHQNKFDAALEAATDPPECIRVPGASFNPETEAYSGDQFKSTDDIATKVEMCYWYTARDMPDEVTGPQNAIEFYKSRDEYSPA